VKLLLDQNLSIRLCRSLADIFPDMGHVSQLGLDEADDLAVWGRARANGLTIVSKDSDFFNLAALLGAPPRVVWIRIGNCTTIEVETLLRRNSVKLHTFHAETDASCLILHR
jgi:predicted nuclease of predicted toxin-antitoxin system